MVYGVGYCSGNDREYSSQDKVFITWRNMLKRCYSNEAKYENYRLQGVTVCEEWLDFSNFNKWYKRNYYEIDGEEMQLDKDIISKGNTVYSPENCVFVPEKINRLYMRDKRHRGNYPIGVMYSKKGGKYISTCGINGKKIKNKHNTVDEAFNEYKRLKEQHVRDVAEEYKNLVPEKVYNSMIMFNVSISD